MTEIQNANERFNNLWEEIGAKRIVVGEEDKGVEVVLDADLSVFAILEKIKEEVERKQREDDLTTTEIKALVETTDAIRKTVMGGFVNRLKQRFR